MENTHQKRETAKSCWKLSGLAFPHKQAALQ